VDVFVFSGNRGKRDSIVVVAQLSPEFTAKLVDRWAELEAQVAAPAVKDPKLAAMILTLQELDAVKQGQERLVLEQARQSEELEKVKDGLSLMEARTQPSTNFYTVLGWANNKGIKIPDNTAGKLGKLCTKASDERGLLMGRVPCTRYGSVKTYHEDVLRDVMGKFLGITFTK